MKRSELISRLDGLCWSARRYGHDDYRLDDEYHWEAVECADELIADGLQVDPE